ncbi:MAG TPA: hypothetical protein VHK64_08665, partial [Nocardioidaceae bacterium]|nr:hypothetical protein [Nocardioidaceae bacterium]
MDLLSRSQVRGALRATLVKDASHEVLFRRSFEAVFPRARAEQRTADPVPAGRTGQSAEDELLDSVVRALREGEEDAIDQALERLIDTMGGGAGDGRSAGHHAQRMLRRMNVPDLYRRYLEEAHDDSGFAKSVNAVEARTAMEQLARRLEDQFSGRLREGDGVVHQQLEDVQDRPLLHAGADELVAMRMAMRPLARRLATKLGAQRRRG